MILIAALAALLTACSRPVPYLVKGEEIAAQLHSRMKDLDRTKKPPPPLLPVPPAKSTFDAQVVARESANIKELVIKDQVLGTGPVAVDGKYVTVHYVGTLPDGFMFDTSFATGREPFTFLLGTGAVIQGWHQGLRGMRVGGTRRLVIPANLAYGAQTNDPDRIPANAALIFDIHLLFVGAHP